MRKPLFALLLVSLQCSGPAQGPDDGTDPDDACSDLDGDGRGVGPGCVGSDCDDSDPEVWEEEACSARCDDDPNATGCPCDRGENPEPQVCYAGSRDTLGVGACRAGLRRCLDDEWTACEGEVVPGDEICNDEDDDCDGEVDEGVRSPCGDCNPECNEDCIGIGCTDGFGPDEDNSSGVVVDEEGALVLDGTTVTLNLIWVANSSEGTVSKIDTRTREEVARYRTGVWYGAGGIRSGLGPSRTSVDFRGDVVVANRAFGRSGSATKILANDCPDRGDGRVDTSSGRTDVLAFDADDDWEDDCIAWHTTNLGNIPRGLAVQEIVGLDGVLEERAWVGLFSDRRYVELDASNGERTGREVETPDILPYGAAIGRDGILWSAGHLTPGIGRIDTETLEYELVRQEGGPGYCYGIAVDEEGDVWCGGWASVYRVDEDRWDEVPVPNNGSVGTNVVHGVGADGAGSIWMGHDTRRSFIRVNRDDASDFSEIPATVNVFGIGIDFDRQVWGIGFGSTGIAVIDADSEEVEVIMDGDDCDGVACLNGAYTYSDMTGFQLRMATNPLGEYTAVFEGCSDEPTRWGSISWVAQTPAGTSLAFLVRTAASLPELGRAPFVQVAATPPEESPVEIEQALAEAGVEPERYLELKLQLRSAVRDASPRVERFSVGFSCEDVVG